MFAIERVATASAALAFLAATATAQFRDIAVSFSPNPAPPGALVDVTITDSTGQGVTLPSPCGWFDIFQGTQTGPQIASNGFCIQILISVSPNGSFTYQWDQIDGNTGLPVPPGRYWFRTNVFGPSSTINDWFALDVQPAGDPTLALAGFVQVGQTNTYTISSPPNAGYPYAILFSFDSNTPVAVPPIVDLAISPPLFVVWNDILDGSGTSSSFAFTVPPQPALAHKGFHFQGLIVDGALNLVDTNDLSLTIAP